MADHTPYQKGIIKRFYENRDTLALQKLGEIVSDLYLEEKPAAIARKWKAAHAQMLAVWDHDMTPSPRSRRPGSRRMGFSPLPAPSEWVVGLAKIVSERA